MARDLAVVDAPTNTILTVAGFLCRSGGPRQPISLVTRPTGVVALGMYR